jgi:hypothetical protein
MAVSTGAAGGLPPNGVVWIDISDLGKRATRASLPLMLARVFIIYMGTLVLVLA